jgi:hypothetical protein
MTIAEHTEQPFRSAQDTIIRAMEEFSIAEPKALVILHTDEAGELVITANTGKCLALGMIETARSMILTNRV